MTDENGGRMKHPASVRIAIVAGARRGSLCGWLVLVSGRRGEAGPLLLEADPAARR